MKKISLKNILRKTFKKPNSKKPTRKVKSVRKIEVTKKIKVAKVRKTNKKIVKKKITISPKTATGIILKNKTCPVSPALPANIEIITFDFLLIKFRDNS